MHGKSNQLTRPQNLVCDCNRVVSNSSIDVATFFVYKFRKFTIVGNDALLEDALDTRSARPTLQQS